MKHYPHHIGDFDKATRHLTRIERSVYRDLIDLYYDTEQRLTLDVQALCRRIIARSNEEATAVQQVLNEFFTETPTGWYHDRCEAEIEAYQANTSQKAIAGKASAEAKRLRKLQALNATSTAVEHPLKTVETANNGTPTNHQPSTNQPINHQPEEVTSSDNSVGAAGAASTKPDAKGSRLPADWQLPKAWGEWALAEYPHWTPDVVRLEAQKFADHWKAVTGKDGRKADWPATWRNWCRNDICQRAHPLQGAARPSKRTPMTDDERAAWAAAEGEKARRLLFGDAPTADLIDITTEGISHEAV